MERSPAWPHTFIIKSFLVLFFKKEHFAFMLAPYDLWRASPASTCLDLAASVWAARL
jgi:hypothetical protein